MDCGTSTAKYVLFAFNTVVVIVGLLGIVFGALILNSIGVIEVDGHVGFPIQAVLPIMLITLGSIVVFIAFLGCCGAIRESVCMTMCYAVFLLVLLIIQLTIVVLLWTNKDKFNSAMGEVIDKAWDSRSKEPAVFEAIQVSLKCCGKNGISDYVLLLQTPPASCCEHNDCLNPLNIYGGCRSKFQEFMSFSTDTAKYVGLGLIAVELVGFIFACCLANNVRNYKRRNAY
ncbi:23 kDa integral membrane protein [Bactrocera neohumeralis]|uniref:23 kDa integral membrane protein n=1 Tax=Bactrocera tryoni TaxID=59916 RepID=UPI001A96C067|nr:23 kDa integral membrane protein [Bactrocera tryoni]XP_050322861.1 23 kDa integral membrane protein [Bactrocera neohumeralis]